MISLRRFRKKLLKALSSSRVQDYCGCDCHNDLVLSNIQEEEDTVGSVSTINLQ